KKEEAFSGSNLVHSLYNKYKKKDKQTKYGGKKIWFFYLN
ncbi:MAG: hypothetical protein ACI9KI_001782, partial [Patiriisocius sp.]